MKNGGVNDKSCYRIASFPEATASLSIYKQIYISKFFINLPDQSWAFSTMKRTGSPSPGTPGTGPCCWAFDMPEAKTKNLAGFTIAVSEPNKKPDPKNRYYLSNRLSFEKGVTAKTAYDARIWKPSDKAPFQAFHWAHYPSLGFGRYTYTIFAMYFDGDSLEPGCFGRSGR